MIKPKKTTYVLEFEFPADTDIDDLFEDYPYGGGLMSKLTEMAKIIQPAFKKASTMRAYWKENKGLT